MKPETQRLKRGFVVSIMCIALASLTACLRATPVPATPVPTSTVTPIPRPTNTPTLPALTPTATPLPLPTATPVPSSDAALSRGPYLQSVTTDTIIVVWDTDCPSYGEVAYGETAEYGLRAVDPVVGTHHAVTLTGLAPYTTYHYRVECEGRSLGEDATFRTAAGPDQIEFDFVVFGDTRTNRGVHHEVADRIVALEPDFVLHTGDMVESGWNNVQWGIFFKVEQELLANFPFFPALGNHEDDSLLYFNFFHLPNNERWYAFDYGHARFISLQVDGYGDYSVGSEQYVWLEETLAATTQRWILAFFHFPAYSSLDEEPYEVNVREALGPLFEQYGVQIAFSGDHHSYQRSVANGVTYIVTAGGGAPLYEITEPDQYLVSYLNDYHVTYVTIDGDTLTSVVVTRDGEEFDRFTLTLP